MLLLCIYLFVYVFIYLFIYLFILFIYLFVYLFIYFYFLFIFFYFFIFIDIFIYVFIYLFIYFFIFYFPFFLIYRRVLGLMQTSRDTETIDDLLSYELIPVPMSMFDDTGVMRIAEDKYKLKKALAVTCSSRNPEINVTILDGCAVLWVI